MQVADGPQQLAQYLRTTSGHAVVERKAMNSDQLHVEVTADDWPRGINRRFFHVGAMNAVIGAEYGGLQPGILKSLNGETGRNEINYTSGPDAETVRLAALHKLDRTMGKRAPRLIFGEDKDFNPDNVHEYGVPVIIVI